MIRFSRVPFSQTKSDPLSRPLKRAGPPLPAVLWTLWIGCCAWISLPCCAAWPDIPLHPDIQAVIDVDLSQLPRAPSAGWADSYSHQGRCYCRSTFDHGIGDYFVSTPLGWLTVRQACAKLGPGPGPQNGSPRYNDVQCGNGPPNWAGDEQFCPGRVDLGYGGCGQIGPAWNFTNRA